MDGQTHDVGKWDLLIAHPPCTYLTVTGNRWFDVARYGYVAQQRWRKRCEAICFFLALAYAKCDRIAVENPVGIMNTIYKKPTQTIQPYMFGDPARKATCLWLKGLPPLVPTDVVNPNLVTRTSKNGNVYTMSEDYGSGTKDSGKRRSKTYPGIAKAMAEQWGGDVRSQV